jgi:hypothetical protein
MNTKQDRRTRPDASDLERGAQYIFQIGRESDSPGVILGEPGVMRWQYQTRPRRSAWSPLNLFKKPDFIVTDPEGREILQIRRVKRFPPTFEIVENNQVVARIARQSILRNKYTIEFNSGPTWTVRMPLFSISFRSESTVGTRVWMWISSSKMQWSILAEPGTDSVHLLSGLAFIHREWWCYS